MFLNSACLSVIISYFVTGFEYGFVVLPDVLGHGLWPSAGVSRLQRLLIKKKDIHKQTERNQYFKMFFSPYEFVSESFFKQVDNLCFTDTTEHTRMMM